MADYKFTQTGAQIQAILNRVANSGIFRHELEFQTTSGNSKKIVIISCKSSSYSQNDLGIDTNDQLLERSKILQMYYYDLQTGCKPILWMSNGHGTASNEIYITTAGASSFSLTTLTTLVSDTVTQLF